MTLGRTFAHIGIITAVTLVALMTGALIAPLKARSNALDQHHIALPSATPTRIAQARRTGVPKRYEAGYGQWHLGCDACTEEFEELLSICWMSPAKGGLTVFPGRADLGAPGSLKWGPRLPEDLVEPKGTLFVAVDGTVVAHVPPDDLLFEALDGAFVVNPPHYDAIVAAISKGHSVTFQFTDKGGRSWREDIALDGFAAALKDLRSQAPRYPKKAVCPLRQK
jgi:invasion protein IalB